MSALPVTFSTSVLPQNITVPPVPGDIILQRVGEQNGGVQDFLLRGVPNGIVCFDADGKLQVDTSPTSSGANAAASYTTSTGLANTGFVSILGKTSGGLKFTTADATAYLVTATLSAQTSGTAALTIPDFAGVSDTFVFATKAATLSNKTFVAPVLGAATATSLNGLTVTTTTGTLTLANGSTLATAGAFSITLTSTAGTNVTLPTTGTLATLAGAEALSNKTYTGTSVAVTAGITSSGATGAGIGYATGAGGTVTQITDATTAVTLDKLSGQITTVALTLAAGVDTSFTLTNSTIAAGDVVVASIKSYGGTADGIPVVNVVATAAGSCVLNVRNVGAVTLDALAVINFAVIKAVAA